MTSTEPPPGTPASSDVDDVEARRTKAYDALHWGMDDKLLMGGNDRALALIGEAYALATSPTRLKWPIPEAAAYRLAYLCMRTARTVEDLRRVHTLLGEARSDATLDPLQHALEVAVCERLGAAQGDGTYWRSEARTAFGRLKASALSGLSRPDGRPAQAEVFNVVEICAFILGEDYDALYGRAALSSAPFVSEENAGYVLVGTHGVDHFVTMEGRFARGEFEARIAAGEADIAFVYEDEPRIVVPLPRRLASPAARNLPNICLGAPLRYDEERSYFGKSLNELNKAVRRAPDDELTFKRKGEVCTVYPRVRILGLVTIDRMDRCFPSGIPDRSPVIAP